MPDDSSLAHAAAALIVFWNGWVKLLAIGYAFSYFAVASTAIYYLLRRDVDARETDEVFLDADGSEQKFGLPRLQKDAAGAAGDRGKHRRRDRIRQRQGGKRENVRMSRFEVDLCPRRREPHS